MKIITAVMLAIALSTSPAMARGSHGGSIHSGGEHSGVHKNGPYNLGAPANNSSVFEDSKMGKDEMLRRQATWDLANGVTPPPSLNDRTK
jgi:hypothetical protein